MASTSRPPVEMSSEPAAACATVASLDDGPDLLAELEALVAGGRAVLPSGRPRLPADTRRARASRASVGVARALVARVHERVAADLRRRLREPVRERRDLPLRTFEWRGLLRFHHRPDGTACALRMDGAGLARGRARRCPAGELQLDLLDAGPEGWNGLVARLYERTLADELAAGVPVARSELAEAVAHDFPGLQSELGADGLWPDPPREPPASLGFDPALLAIARRIRSLPGRFTCTLAAYNLVARHRPEFLLLERDNASLILLYATFRADPRFPATGEPIARLRRHFASLGLSRALWRRIARPDGCERLLGIEVAGYNLAAPVVELLRAADEIGPQFDPPSWLLAASVQAARNLGERAAVRRERMRPVLRRLAQLHQRADAFERDLIRTATEAMLDWCYEYGVVDAYRFRRASLFGLLFGLVGRRPAAGDPPITWPTPFDRMAIDGWEVVVLGDSDALREEGRTMEHCVANFVGGCSFRQWLVCSIRAAAGDGGRWTASFFHYEGRWHLDAVRGLRNAAPSEDAVRVSLAIAQRLAA